MISYMQLPCRQSSPKLPIRSASMIRAPSPIGKINKVRSSEKKVPTRDAGEVAPPQGKGSQDEVLRFQGGAPGGRRHCERAGARALAAGGV